MDGRDLGRPQARSARAAAWMASRALNVEPGLASSSLSQSASVSGRYGRQKTVRLAALGSSRLVKRVSMPVDS